MPLKLAGLPYKSKEMYENVLINHIRPEIGDLPPAAVKPLHIGELLATMDGRSSSLRSKKTIRYLAGHETAKMTLDACAHVMSSRPGRFTYSHHGIYCGKIGKNKKDKSATD